MDDYRLEDSNGNFLRDTYNSGYYMHESMKYGITLNKTKNYLYEEPFKLEFEARYNKGNTPTNFYRYSLDTDVHVERVNKKILYNSDNPDDKAAFDDHPSFDSDILFANESYWATKLSADNVLTVTNFTNKINGIPNLSVIGTHGFTLTFNYSILGYSIHLV